MSDEIVPTYLPKFVIMGIAEGFAETFNYSPGMALDEFIVRLGGTLAYPDENRDQGGQLIVEGPKNFRIVLQNHGSPQGASFAIVHQIGHYFLHSLMGKKRITIDHPGQNLENLYPEKEEKDQIEVEAHWFAVAFQMPAKKVKAARQVNPDLADLAKHFHVSREAMRARLLDLEIAPKTWKPF
ncbi:ImmA/IrrE family metallo-endopeptidase [bacterium]|jgi:Zn-dependent peptidase ImmA (M78 family)|nr:ImmA/IrrE family metallo-endopeptidase [bacterium]